MNARCQICDAVIERGPGQDRCPECGARRRFQTATNETPRHARSLGADAQLGWEITPEGPHLVRLK